MASREETKAARRIERERTEREAAARAKRARLAQLGGGALLALALVAGLVILALSSTGDQTVGPEGPSGKEVATVPLPPKREDNLQAAVKLAGCQIRETESLGAEHVSDTRPVGDYNTNPPSSGPHSPISAEDGTYDPGSSPDYMNWIHSLEHGRVITQYAPGTPPERIDQLEALTLEPIFGAPGGYHTLVFQNNTNMPYQVAAVGWTATLGCDRLTDQTFDAIRAFRKSYTDEGPENVP